MVYGIWCSSVCVICLYGIGGGKLALNNKRNKCKEIDWVEEIKGMFVVIILFFVLLGMIKYIL